MTARSLLLLAVGATAISFAGPVIAWLVVPPLAIAFWRNALATVALAPAVVATRRPELARLDLRRTGLVVLAGTCLAAHFGTWVTSLTMTTVAASTALVSLQVVWVLLLRSFGADRPTTAEVAGVLVATAGAVVVTGVDLADSGRAVAGDLLALAGSLAMAAYTLLGGSVRRTVTTTTYTFLCYGTAAVLLLGAAVAAGQPLTGYAGRQWLGLLVVVATAQLLGHSVFNHLLATVSPTVVGLALLVEIPGAALVAAAWLGQVPAAATWVGLVLVLAGTAVVVTGARRPVALPESP